MGRHKTNTTTESWIRTGLLFVFLVIYAYLMYRIYDEIKRISDFVWETIEGVGEIADPSVFGSVVSALIAKLS